MEQTALGSDFAVSLCSENDNAQEYGDLRTNYKRILNSQLELELELEFKKLIKQYADQQIRNSDGREQLHTDLHYDLCEKCEKLKQNSIENIHYQGNYSQISHINHLNLDHYNYQKLQSSKHQKYLGVNACDELGLSNKQYHFEELKHHFAEKVRNALDLEICVASRPRHLNETITTDKISKLTFEECKLQNDNLESKQAEFNHQMAYVCIYKIPLTNTNFDDVIVEVGVQLQFQKYLVKRKEEEMDNIQQYFRNCLEIEQNLDSVHELSLDYNHSIHKKTTELISLKSKQQILEDNLTALLQLRCENLHQSKANKVDDNENYRFDLFKLKANHDYQQQELRELHLQTEELMKYKDDSQQLIGIKSELKRLNNELKTARNKYEFIKDLCETTQVQLQLIKVANSSSNKYKNKQLHSESDKMRQLRYEFQIYIKKTFDLANKLDNIQHNLQQVMHENQLLKCYHPFDKMNSFGKDQNQTIGYRIQNNTVEENSDENLMDAYPSCGQSKPKSVTPESSVLPLIETKSCQSNIIQQILSKRSSITTDELTFIRFEQLLKENETLKQQLIDKTNKITEIELNTDIQENILKCEKFEKLLLQQQKIVKKFQKKLLINDSKLYKMEKNIPDEASDCNDMQTIKEENQRLKQELEHEINLKTEYQKQLNQVQTVVAELQVRLHSLTSKRIIIDSKTTQTVLPLCDNQIGDLKANVEELELRLDNFNENDVANKQECLNLLKKLIEVQDSRILFMQQNQKDWEDLMSSLRESQAKERHLKRELQLKRMELDHLNKIFTEQNKELKRFEQFAVTLENKRQSENNAMRQSFHNKMYVLQQQLLYLNQQLVARQDRDKPKDKDVFKNTSKSPTEDSSTNSLTQTSTTKQPEILQRLESIKNRLKQIKEFNQTKQTSLLASTSAAIHNQYESIKKDNLDAKRSGKTDDDLCSPMHVMPYDDKSKESRLDQLFKSMVENIQALLTSLYRNVSLDSGIALNLPDMKMFTVDHFRALADQATSGARNDNVANCTDNPSVNPNNEHKAANFINDFKRLQRAAANPNNVLAPNNSQISVESVEPDKDQDTEDL